MEIHERPEELVSDLQVPSEDVCLHFHAIQRAEQGPHPLLALPEKLVIPVQESERFDEVAEHLDRLELIVAPCVEDAQHLVGVLEGSIVFLCSLLYSFEVHTSVFIDGIQLEPCQSNFKLTNTNRSTHSCFEGHVAGV